MKKLMILAASAAMIGGASADFAYDFTANLTTTKGAEGRATKINYTVNLGMDEQGAWWYDDDIFQDEDAKYKYADLGDGLVPVLKVGTPKNMYPWKLNTAVVKTDEQKAALAEALGFDGEKTNYNVQKVYRNRKVWCETFRYSETIPAECYRTTGTAKLVGEVYIDDCCGTDSAVFVDDVFGETDIAIAFINRFGAQTLDKATKVEALLTVGEALDAGNGTNFGFALAGQGTWSFNLKDADNNKEEGINNLGGSIVGYLPAPTCETCCADEASALVFSCDGVEDYDGATPTAAYGTWTLKFNKKNSEFLIP